MSFFHARNLCILLGMMLYVTLPTSVAFADGAPPTTSALVDAPDSDKCAAVIAESDNLAQDGDNAGAIKTLVDARAAGLSDARIDSALERIVSSGLPNRLPRAIFAKLPVDTRPINASLGLSAIVKPYLPSDAEEPRDGVHFPRACYIYRPDRTSPQTYVCIFCRVHYMSSQDADLALRVGQLLLYGRHVLMNETQRAPFNDDDAPIDVWLCRTGPAGGEQWRNNIYFYDLDTNRSSIEWIREILHEYSHLAFPAIGGFTAPEYWANGYMGERLLVRWIERTPGGPAMVNRLWGDFSGAPNFNRLLIVPPIELYRKIGPSRAWQTRTDELGMRYLIGQVLTIDDKYGPVVLGKALNLLPIQEARPVDVTTALQDVIDDSRPSKSGTGH